MASWDALACCICPLPGAAPEPASLGAGQGGYPGGRSTGTRAAISSCSAGRRAAGPGLPQPRARPLLPAALQLGSFSGKTARQCERQGACRWNPERGWQNHPFLSSALNPTPPGNAWPAQTWRGRAQAWPAPLQPLSKQSPSGCTGLLSWLQKLMLPAKACPRTALPGGLGHAQPASPPPRELLDTCSKS